MRPSSAGRRVAPEDELGLMTPVRLHLPISSKSRQIVCPEMEADSTLDMGPRSAGRRVAPEDELGLMTPVRLHLPISSKSRQIVCPEMEAESTPTPDLSFLSIWKRISDDYFGHGPSAWYLSSGDQVRPLPELRWGCSYHQA